MPPTHKAELGSIVNHNVMMLMVMVFLTYFVPLYYNPGLAAVKYVGTSTLQQLWITNTEGSSGSGSVMAKPVAGDIDGDGKLDIFIASQDVSPGGWYDDPVAKTGYHSPDGYDGTVCRINSTNGQHYSSDFYLASMFRRAFFSGHR